MKIIIKVMCKNCGREMERGVFDPLLFECNCGSSYKCRNQKLLKTFKKSDASREVAEREGVKLPAMELWVDDCPVAVSQ